MDLVSKQVHSQTVSSRASRASRSAARYTDRPLVPWPAQARRAAFHRICARNPDDAGVNSSAPPRPAQPKDSLPKLADFSRGIPDILSADEETETAREKFWGKIAVLVLGAVLAGERITGEGFVASLDHKVGISFWEAEPFIGVIVLFLLSVGVYPSRTRLLHPRQRDRAQLFAGLQRLVGRLACLTLAGTIILEVLTGKGMLKLLNIETGLERLSEVEFGVAFLLVLFLTEEPKDLGSND